MTHAHIYAPPTMHIIITQQSNSEEEYEREDDTTITGYYDSRFRR